MSGVGEQLRNLSNPSDVLLAFFLGEAQVLVQPGSHVVAVESVRGNPLRYQVGFQLEGDRGLPGAGKSREPDAASSEPGLLAQDLSAFVSGDVVVFLADIRRDLLIALGKKDAAVQL